jgi:DNA-binding FadR family transcriptional regulator
MKSGDERPSGQGDLIAQAAPTTVRGRSIKHMIRIPKTAEVVAGDIRKRIIRGEIKEGDFLQPEAQLMEHYGTSRPTIREAFRILENEQFISVTRGSRSGAKVHAPKVDGVARYAGFALQAQGALLSDIYNARLVVGPPAAAMAAHNRTPEDLTRLRGELARLETFLDQPDRGSEYRVAVARFHQAIVETAGSATLNMIWAMLANVIETHQAKFVSRRPAAEQFSRPQAIRRNRGALASFKKVIDLIEARDGAGAEQHWRRHIENGNASWLMGYDQITVVDVLE